MLKLYKFLKRYTRSIVFVFVLVFLQTIADLYLPTLMADIIDKGVMKGDTDFIWKTGGFMLLISGGSIICAIIASLLSSRAAVGLGTIIRNKVFNKVERFSLYEFDKIGTSTLITRTTNDINQVQMVTVIILRMMIMAPMMAIGGVILALSKDTQLTLVLVVAIPVLVGVIILLATRIMPLFKVVQKKIDRINLVLREKLMGIRVIRAFNTVEYENKRFEEANNDLTQNYIKVNIIMAFMMPSIMFIMNLTSLAILWFGIIRINDGGIDMGVLLAFTQYAMQIMFSLLMVAMMFIMVPRAQAAAVRINEVLDKEGGIEDLKEGNKDSSGKGNIDFKDVTFSYAGAEQPAICNITFEAKPGEITAIIGSTGSGKSALINLIPRFYDAQSGSVLIDGVDIKEISRENLRKKIGLVSQNAILFSGTVSENIRVGNENASDEEVIHSAKVAQAHDFILRLENGYEHEIAQGGINLSGGQKQRIAIARALVRKPEIFIFDDSFSALDFETDAQLRQALKGEIAESTVIIVAQRVGTIMSADRIVVLDEGRIVGIGTHNKLLETCEVYRQIVLSQLSEEEIA